MLWVTMTMVNSSFRLVDQLLNARRRDRVERGGRLVEQDHLRLDRDPARDA
jgi:hypothetical protein